MKPVDQVCVDSGRGDCARAVVASLLELELEQVPHFRLYPDSQWFNVFYYFFYSMGWSYEGCWDLPRRVNGIPIKDRKPLLEHSINGYFDATVPSKTFGDGFLHAVVMDINGVVVHDPNPNKLWQGINIIETGELKNWYLFEPVKSQ